MNKKASIPRREFMKSACAGIALASFTPGLLSGVQEKPAKPNVVLIFVDDNVVETMHSGGLCPNIKDLGNKGVTFTHAFTPHGVCGPSRFAVLSGRTMSRCIEKNITTPESRIHGSKAIGGTTIEGQRFIWSGHILNEEWNVGKLMKHAGYKTFYAGKVHGHMQDGVIDNALREAAKTDPRKTQEVMRQNLQQAGWDEADALAPGNLSSSGREAKGIPADSHCPEWRAQATMKFIEKNKDNPFFCYIAENLMHMPSPAGDMKKDPRVVCGGVTLDMAPDVMPSRQSVFDRVEKAGLKGNEYAALLWLDDMVGAIVGKLEDLELRDNTMVVFIQDNGHHWEGKNSVYDGGLHVSPAYISWPAGTKNPGRVCHELISTLDLTPTFMDAAGLKKPADCVLDGVSAMSLLKGRNRPIHDSLYAEMGHTRAVTTKKWKYIALRVPSSRQFNDEEKKIYDAAAKGDPTGQVKQMGCRPTHMQNSDVGGVPGTWQTHRDHYFDVDQLYDLENDPAELKNLASDKKYAKVLADMKKRLREYCLDLPGTFAEFKTLDECSPRLQALVAKARKEPLIPVSNKNRRTPKKPKNAMNPHAYKGIINYREAPK
jgi:arylsulfatase A-like enzyme